MTALQPMETAPKNGQDIVALVDEGWGYGPAWRVIHWNDGIGKAAYTWPCWMCSTCTIQMDEKRFKGWLPLPDARATLRVAHDATAG